MNDTYRIAHFDLATERLSALTPSEELRIRQTAALVPSAWRRIVDVGCGDGRVSKLLIERGCEVVGIDWSANSVAHFPGPTRVCDIRAAWPFAERFDGAICCEVLEHLLPDECAQVVANLKAFTRLGFLITVPAREAFDANHVRCQACNRNYHIWGHCRRFESFEDVDAMVKQPSVSRKLISRSGVRCSRRIAAWQRRLGFTPWAASYLCPYCGDRLRKQPPPPRINRLANKGLAAFQRLGSPFRQPGGWFACLYGV